MGFLIKCAFWLSLVLLVIPFGNSNDNGESTIGAIETFFAARAVIDDMSGLCERRPEACEVGRSAFHTIGVRAREGARIAYGMLDEHFGEAPPAEVANVSATDEQLHTGSVPVPTARAAAARE
jgi:hypothetical protein